MKCGVCERDWADHLCKVIELTETEKATIAEATGRPAPATYIYCLPCWKLLANRKQGAEFISGSVRASLRNAGHPKSQIAGQKMLEFLLAKSGKSVS